VAFFAIVKWLNQRATTVVTAILLVELCSFTHFLALTKMDVVERKFPIMNPRTEHNMSLIDFLNGHRWFVVVFILMFIGSLLYLELRNVPRWSVWLTFFLFAAPCLMYLIVCAYISNKFVFL
jgi:hypothetical protein